MMVIDQLRAKSMELRKDPERKWLAPSIMFAISEIEKIGKNASNRATTDDEAIKVVQKIIITLEDNIALATDTAAIGKFTAEHDVLRAALPKMASDQEIAAFLSAFMTGRSKMSSVPKKGDIMKALRDHFGALADMKRAGQIATEIYGV
jgi:uncharacterized protein YqeY